MESADDIDRDDDLPARPRLPVHDPMPSDSRVAVLICTYQGERYLRRQLQSIVDQTHSRWEVYVSDDGSTDGTKAVLAEFRHRLGADRLRTFEGPRSGFADNFLSLIGRSEIAADFYALTDQDDEWEDTKLARAVGALDAAEPGRAAMYGSRSEFIDAEGRHLGFSRSFARPPGFANALVQNMATGNTMVLNHAAIRLLRAATYRSRVSAHDWWAYLLVTGSGGAMFFDSEPTVRYRQHGKNLYGENRSLRSRLRRIRMVASGDFRRWNDANVDALRENGTLLTAGNRERVERFARSRAGVPWMRLVHLWRSGVYRQTMDGQIALLLATLLGRA